jgi:hypothetical protein
MVPTAAALCEVTKQVDCHENQLLPLRTAIVSAMAAVLNNTASASTDELVTTAFSLFKSHSIITMLRQNVLKSAASAATLILDQTRYATRKGVISTQRSESSSVSNGSTHRTRT